MVRSHVFLDFGGTLARVRDEVSEPWQVWAAAGRPFGLELTEPPVRKAIEAVDVELQGKIYEYLGQTREYWQLYEGLVLDRLGVKEHRVEIEAAVQAAFDDPARVELFPDARDALDALQAEGFHLGIISNHHDGLLKVLRHLDLERYFDTITYSQEAGAEKPDAAVFSLAVNRARCKPSQAVHVGDSWEADLVGASQAGIRGIWLNRSGATPPAACDSVQSLGELPRLLHRMI